MKRCIFFSLLAIALNSCITTSQITETNDSYLGIDKIKLSLTTSAFSEEKFGALGVIRSFTMGSTYLYERKKNEQPSISVNLQISTPIRPEELDSVMFLVIDNEKIRLSSNKYTYKEFVSSSEQSAAETNEKSAEKKENESRTVIVSGTNQLMNRSFIIPQNLWVPIANAERIRYRIYLGKDGYNARPIQLDIKKLKEFFSLAISKRDALNPPLREGEKKL